MHRPVSPAAGLLLAALFLLSAFSSLECALAQAAGPSLAERARAAQAQPKPAAAPSKTYDNDTLPKHGTLSIVGRSEPTPAAASGAAKKVETTPAADQARARLQEQKRRVADLEYELNRLEADNRVLRAEFEDPATGKAKPRPMICGYTGPCAPWAPADLDRYQHYLDYAGRRNAKRAELQDARQLLDKFDGEARRPVAAR